MPNDAEPPDLPPRETFRTDPIEHAHVWADMTVSELVTEYGKTGIGGIDLHRAVDIFTEMVRRESVTVFFGLAGPMVPAGMQRIITELLRDGYIDVLVTTGATLTHDTIEAIGGNHHHGSATPIENPGRNHDETLRDEEIDRIYNVYLPQEHFTALENHLREQVFPSIERTVSIQEFVAAVGQANAAVNHHNDLDSDPGIAAAAVSNDIPIFVPGIQDSVLGLQAWMYSQLSDFSLDALADMTSLNDVANDADATGAFVVGGGVPKNYVLQAMLVTPKAYEYAVQLTMDPEHTGGLTGASLDEARSWGKLERHARNATVLGDATITLPIVVAGARTTIDRDQ